MYNHAISEKNSSSKNALGYVQTILKISYYIKSLYITNLFEKKRANVGTPLAISRLSIVSDSYLQ